MENVGGVEQPKRYVAIFYVLAAIILGLFDLLWGPLPTLVY